MFMFMMMNTKILTNNDTEKLRKLLNLKLCCVNPQARAY